MQLLTEDEATTFLALAAGTLRTWRTRGEGPPFIRLNGKGAVRYDQADLITWVQRDRVNPSGDAA